jgi:aquaporin Z
MTENRRIFVAELVGTAILVIGGCGTALFAGAINGGTLAVATAFGLSLLVLVYVIGNISGCHVNPAVTLGMWSSGKIETGVLAYYWIAQLIGGAVGGLILWATFRISDIPLPAGFASNGYGENSPGAVVNNELFHFNLGSVALTEIVMTALLVFAVLATTHGKYPAGFAGVSVGFSLFLIHLVSIPIDNTSVNPARSLGVALFASESWPLEQVWAFFVFPLIGGGIGALLWRVVANEPGPEGAEVPAT